MSYPQRILQYIEKKGQASVPELIEHTGLSRTVLYEQLARLRDSNKLTKIGSPPKTVYYRLNSEETNRVSNIIKSEPAIVLPQKKETKTLLWPQILVLFFLVSLISYQTYYAMQARTQLNQIKEELIKNKNELGQMRIQLTQKMEAQKYSPNAGLVQIAGWTKAGVIKEIIVYRIKSSHFNYRLSVDDVDYLQKQKVDPLVIKSIQIN